MSDFKYSLTVFIGRFQPFHLGHLQIVEEALKQSYKILILVGSADGPRSYRNPWSFKERETMIYDAIMDRKDEDYHYPKYDNRIIIRPLPDADYNDVKWIENVQNIVNSMWDKNNPDAYFRTLPKTVALVGHSKDSTSYYLNLFPQWDSIRIENFNGINSTDIRKSYFTFKPGGIPTVDLPTSISKYFIDFCRRKEYDEIRQEYDFIAAYKKGWEAAPYPPTFVTVDAVVIQSGHILLVKRKDYPGKGQWALPGGYLNQTETLEEGMIRELREETRIAVPKAVIKGSITKKEVFDGVNRSARGRVITHAFLIQLAPDRELPKVKGSDDAEKAKWIPLSEVKRERMFEDHYAIIQVMTGAV